MKPRYFPDLAHVYLGSVSFSGRSILVLMSSKGSSHSGMFFVFFMFASIVVMVLYVDMMVWIFLPCFVQEWSSAAVSSAKVRMWVCGILHSITLNSESEEIAKIRGESGHPWRMPRVAVNPGYTLPWI